MVGDSEVEKDLSYVANAKFRLLSIQEATHASNGAAKVSSNQLRVFRDINHLPGSSRE